VNTRPLPSPRLTAPFATLVALSLVALPAWADPPAPPPPPPAAVAPPVAALPPAPPPAVSRKNVALGAAGVAVASAVGAVVFGVLALHEKSLYEQTPTYANTDNGNNFAAYADGCIALAAAAGITSLVLYLTSADGSGEGTAAPPKRSAVFSASPIVLGHGGGAGAVLRF
jgi:hypothetical protein